MRAPVLDSRAKCNRALCEPDLYVFAKLFEDCLKRSLEAQAFSGRQIGGDDDVLDFLVGQFVDVDLARHQRRNRPLAFSTSQRRNGFDAALFVSSRPASRATSVVSGSSVKKQSFATMYSSAWYRARVCR
jgi:hypothetical protein